MSKGTPDNGGTPAAKVNAGKETPRGRPFKPGNPGGPGNPFVKLTHALKVAICRYSEEEYGDAKTYAEVMAEDLWKMAVGDRLHPDDKTYAAQRWAMQTILDRALGKPKETHEIKGNLTVTEFFRAISEPTLLTG